MLLVTSPKDSQDPQLCDWAKWWQKETLYHLELLPTQEPLILYSLGNHNRRGSALEPGGRLEIHVHIE